MKYFLILITLIFFSARFYGQSISDSTKSLKDSIYTDVDEQASYKGGEKAWLNYLMSNINRDILFENNAPQGVHTVMIKYVVKSDGSIGNIECDNSAGYGMCKEGIRVIKKSKKWIPAKVNGKNVSSIRKQPLTLERIGW